MFSPYLTTLKNGTFIIPSIPLSSFAPFSTPDHHRHQKKTTVQIDIQTVATSKLRSIQNYSDACSEFLFTEMAAKLRRRLSTSAVCGGGGGGGGGGCGTVSIDAAAVTISGWTMRGLSVIDTASPLSS